MFNRYINQAQFYTLIFRKNVYILFKKLKNFYEYKKVHKIFIMWGMWNKNWKPNLKGKAVFYLCAIAGIIGNLIQPKKKLNNMAFVFLTKILLWLWNLCDS